MAEVTGFTSQRMLVIENETVVDGEVQGDNLILITREGTPIDAGNVRGPVGPVGPPVADGDKGDITVSTTGTNWQINPKVVTNAELADMLVGSIKGNLAGSAGRPADLTAVQVVGMMPIVSRASRGVVPPLPADGTPNEFGWLNTEGNWSSGFPFFTSITDLNTRWPPTIAGAGALAQVGGEFYICSSATWQRWLSINVVNGRPNAEAVIDHINNSGIAFQIRDRGNGDRAQLEYYSQDSGLTFHAGWNTPQISCGDGSGNFRVYWYNAGIGGELSCSVKDVNGNTSYRVIAVSMPSERELKTNIDPVDGESVLEKLNSVPVYRFQYLDPIESDEMHTGFMADEVDAIFPEIVAGTGVGIEGEEIPRTVINERLVPSLVSGIQTLLSRITDLEARVSALETV